MATVKGPRKGMTEELVISTVAPRRFLVGLSWNPPPAPRLDIKISDPPDKKDKLRLVFFYLMKPLDFIRVLFLSFFKLVAFDMYSRTLSKEQDAKGRDKQAEQHDLDLDCYIFDKNMVLKQVVGTEDDNFIDPSRKVYHSGENQSGMGGPDDEQVFVELHGIPDDYHHFFFTVKSDSRYSFEEINEPVVRLADSKTNDNLLENTINPPVHLNAHGYVFCHVFREGDGWKFRNIDEFTGDDVNWEKVLSSYAARP